VSERFIPLAVIPFMSQWKRLSAKWSAAVTPDTWASTCWAIERCGEGLKNLGDPSWNRYGTRGQQLGVGVHLHASAGLAGKAVVAALERV